MVYSDKIVYDIPLYFEEEYKMFQKKQFLRLEITGNTPLVPVLDRENPAVKLFQQLK